MALSDKLIKKIKNNTFINEELDLSNKSLTDSDAIKLAEVLKTNTHIKKINLSSNYIGDQGIQALLASFQNVVELDVSYNSFENAGIIALSKCNLKKLNISGNSLGDNIALFATNIHLLELDAQWCKISNAGLRALFKSQTLQSLDLSGNSLQEEAFETLPFNTSLRILILNQCGLGPECAKPIAKNKSLKKADLSTNNLGDTGAEILATENDSIEDLDLSQNGITDVGAGCLGSQHSTLKKLRLFNNRITYKATKGFSQNSTLTHLDLSNNQIDSRCARYLVVMPALRFLSLINNKVGKEGAETLKSKANCIVSLAYNPVHEEKMPAKRKTSTDLEQEETNSVSTLAVQQGTMEKSRKKPKPELGSGATPISSMQKLVNLRKQFNHGRTLTAYKKNFDYPTALLFINGYHHSYKSFKKEELGLKPDTASQHLNGNVIKRKFSADI